MTEKDTSGIEEFIVEIEKCSETTKIRVTGVSGKRFDQAYKLVSQLCNRAGELDSEIKEELKLRFMKNQTKHLWTQEGTIWKLDESITDTSYRIALSLLRTHPQCKSQVDVVSDTGIPKMTVSNHLSGKVKSTRQYFYACDKGHKLSDEGLLWTLDKATPLVTIPSVVGISDGE